MEAIIWNELTGGLYLKEVVTVIMRLLVAMMLGAVIGLERDASGKAAGLRTHMLVALGSAFFVVVPLELGMSLDEVARIAQGVATGVGFLGAGAILKVSEQGEIKGLTTAAGIWVTAAVGMAAGMGRIWIAVLGVALVGIVLAVLGRVQQNLQLNEQKQEEKKSEQNPAPSNKKLAALNKEE
ncbi:MAG: MgtC/SapB family protein [Candidatus Competibacteraceae bacterium]|nr:MgtC/SapB family protein [Candidatus Competibacteraceae bacterium]MBK8898004.1 MgtC/SapB family protein [Candidatus Competibacteraceae bacterium]MBK8961808.1 MgtC/SapB family protein [Candidatus Competibacteraceae bacterium]